MTLISISNLVLSLMLCMFLSQGTKKTQTRKIVLNLIMANRIFVYTA